MRGEADVKKGGSGMTPRRHNRKLYAAVLYRVLVDQIPIKEVASEFGFRTETERKRIYHVIERYSLVFHEKRNGEIWGIKVIDLRRHHR